MAQLSRTFVELKKKPYSIKCKPIEPLHERGRNRCCPGKVLGAGKANHPMTVAAFAFSDRAKTKILKAKGNCLSIRDLMEKNPTGKNVKLMG